MIIVCEVCKREKPNDTPFMVPKDEHGIAMMQEHLRVEHNITK